MAEYGKYTDINESQLSSDASSLQGKLKTAQSELSSFQGTLTDDIWKAGAKATLLTAFGTINDDVYANLDSDLTKIISIAAEIGNYKKAETAAKGYKKDIEDLKSAISAAESADPPEPTGDLYSAKATAEANLATEEQNMETAVTKINALNA